MISLQTSSLKKVKVFVTIIIFLFFFVCFESQAVAEEGNALSEEFLTVSENKKIAVPFELKDNLIYIKVRINGSEKEYDFLLDTGAGVTVIKKSVAEALGLEKSSVIQTEDLLGNTKSVDIVTVSSLKFGDINFVNSDAASIDLEPLEVDFDGVIGNNFLNLFLVHIDYDRCMLTSSQDQCDLEEFDLGEKLDFSFSDGGCLIIKLKIGDDIAMDAALDTGSGGESFLQVPLKHLEKFKPYLNCKQVTSKGMVFWGAYGGTSTIVSRLSELKLGDIKVNNLPVQFFATDYINIPNYFLSHFNLIINYPEMKIYFIENENRHFNDNKLIFGYTKQMDSDGKQYIAGIWEDSPADRCGLQVGDEIIRETFEGDTVRIVVNGENGEKEILLEKDFLLPPVEN